MQISTGVIGFKNCVSVSVMTKSVSVRFSSIAIELKADGKCALSILYDFKCVWLSGRHFNRLFSLYLVFPENKTKAYCWISLEVVEMRN